MLHLKAGRAEHERVFARLPCRFDVHAYRREYAQALSLQHAPGRTLPPSQGRLNPHDYDRNAAQRVTEALGHKRLEVVLQHYLRYMSVLAQDNGPEEKQ